RAGARRRGAGAGQVALIERRADHGVLPDAGAGLAGIGLGAGVAIVAHRPVGLERVRARAARRGADAGRMALVERRADHGVASRARARLAGVGLGAAVAIVAHRPIGLERLRTGTGRRDADTGRVALVHRRADHRVL